MGLFEFFKIMAIPTLIALVLIIAVCMFVKKEPLEYKDDEVTALGHTPGTAVKENENKTGLYSTQAKTSRKVAAPAPKPLLSEEEAYKREIARQMEEYSQGR